ncbi:MAG: right-handed parallel beta-helix repeat-containing protein [Eubacteriales bacterium]|nr:right-handed parallel beta-helix repeat-containing protein [Eubacteriales bacterium]
MKEKEFVKKRRQLLSAALSACLMLTAAPAPAFASGGGQNEIFVTQVLDASEETEWQETVEISAFSDGSEAESCTDSLPFLSNPEEAEESEAAGDYYGDGTDDINQYEAQIGENKYSTLEDAWKAAGDILKKQDTVSEDNPVVITLLKDCTIEESLKLQDSTSSRPAIIYKGYIKITSEAGQDAKTIKRGKSFGTNNNAYMIYLSSEASGLILENIVLDGNKEEGYTGGGIKINKGSARIGSGTVIRNNNNFSSGSGIFVGNDAKVEMTGGSIEENQCSGDYRYGGGIYVDGDAEFTMTGGIIKNNSSYKGGGIGISNNQTKKVLLTGGEISGNSAKYDSEQQIWVSNSILGMGGSISVSGNIELSYFGNNNGKIMLVSPLENNLKLKFEAVSIDLGTTVVIKGEDYSGDLDASKFTLEGISDRGLAVSGDGQSIIASTADVQYTISVQTSEGMGLISGIYDRTLKAGKDYKETLKFSDEYAENYVFPADEDDWKIDGGDNSGKMSIKSDDDYDTVELTLSGYKSSLVVVAYAEEKIAGPKASVVSVNYLDGTLTYDDTVYEVYKDKQKNEKVESDSNISELIQADKEAVTVYVRTKRTEEEVQSKWTAVTIQPRADYSAVYAALEKAQTYNLDLYTDDTVKKLKDAITVVDRGKNKTEQDAVNAMAKAIEDAIEGLEYREADYSAVDAALKKVPTNLNLYTAETVKKLRDAIKAVVRGKKITEQAKVDAMAQAIETAIKNLQEEYIYIPTPEPTATPTPKPLPENVPDGSKWDGDNIVTPDGTVIKPDGTIVLPDGAEVKPEADGTKPSINKDGTVTDTNGTTIDKDGTIILPGENLDSTEDDTRIEQGEGTKKPIYNPESGSVTTEEGNKVTQPGGNQVNPPAGSVVEIDGTIKEPDGTVVTPDGTTTKPDGTVITPDGTTTKPDGTVIAPDGTTTKPDGTVIDPDGTVHNTDGSIQSSDGTYLCPATPWLESAEVYNTGNQVKAILSGPAAGAQGYDYVISENINCIKDKDYLAVSKNILLTETDFRYIPAGTYYVYCHAWIRGADGKKIFGNWSNYKTVTVTAITPQTPVIRSVKVKGNTVTVTYSQCEDASGYDIVLGNAAKKVYNEKRPVDYGTKVKKIKNGNTVTAVFRNVEPGIYYVGLHAWNRTSEDGKKVFSPWSNVKKIKVK